MFRSLESSPIACDFTLCVRNLVEHYKPDILCGCMWRIYGDGGYKFVYFDIYSGLIFIRKCDHSIYF